MDKKKRVYLNYNTGTTPTPSSNPSISPPSTPILNDPFATNLSSNNSTPNTGYVPNMHMNAYPADSSTSGPPVGLSNFSTTPLVKEHGKHRALHDLDTSNIPVSQHPPVSSNSSPSVPFVPAPVSNKPSTVSKPAHVVITSDMLCPAVYARSTLGTIPHSNSLLQKIGIPFGILLHPMVQNPSPADKILEADMNTPIIRCRSCKSYINPFVSWKDNGKRWICNLCNFTNEVPSDYQSKLNEYGQREDAHHRPELRRGCVEWSASEYGARAPSPPTYVFVIEVTQNAAMTGMLYMCVETIKRALDSFESRSRIAFVTFDGAIHFYKFKLGSQQPEMLIVGDIDEVFVPSPVDLLVNLESNRESIDAFLNKLPSMFQSTQKIEAALGPAVVVASHMMSQLGGRMYVFSATIPNCGPGKLVNREDLKLLGTPQEVSLLLPESEFYKNFAVDCSQAKISVSLYCFSGQFQDLATLGSMPQFTGGQLFYYPSFRADKDGERFFRDFYRDLTRQTGFDSVMRVRTSKALKLVSQHGNFFVQSQNLLTLPHVDADKSYGFQFEIQSNITTSHVAIQIANLFCLPLGDRRVRVFTILLPVSSSLHDIYKTIDPIALTAFMAKNALDAALNGSLGAGREYLVNTLINTLVTYRTEVQRSNSPQLMLPDQMMSLPLMALAILKSSAFRNGNIRPDERVYWHHVLRNLGAPQMTHFLLPRLFSLHNLSSEAGVLYPNSQICSLPPVLSLSSDKLARDGLYLLDDSFSLYLYLGTHVSPTLLQAVFGVSDMTQIQPNTLPVLENELSQKINNIVTTLRAEQFMSAMPLHVVRHGDEKALKFMSYFVEDKSNASQSYHEFLLDLTKKVLDKSKR